jgi:hypothetical protein
MKIPEKFLDNSWKFLKILGSNMFKSYRLLHALIFKAQKSLLKPVKGFLGF